MVVVYRGGSVKFRNRKLHVVSMRERRRRVSYAEGAGAAARYSRYSAGNMGIYGAAASTFAQRFGRSSENRTRRRACCRRH